jgi:hypothetical protein
MRTININKSKKDIIYFANNVLGIKLTIRQAIRLYLR